MMWFDLRRLPTTYLPSICAESERPCNVSYKRKSRWPSLVGLAFFAVYVDFWLS